MIEAENFTAFYDQVEDRIRLIVNHKINQKRFDFMITRDFVLKLFPVVEEFYIKHYNEPLVFEDNINKFKKNSEFIEPRIESKQNDTVTKTRVDDLVFSVKEEGLLIKVDLKFDANSQSTHLTLYTKNQASKAVLNKDLIRMVFAIIHSAIPNIGWGIAKLV